MYMRFAARDLSIVAASLALWWLLARHSGGAGAVADFTGWVCGLSLAACAYLAHEWSHFLGAKAIGSRVTPGTSLASGFLFSFDAESNSLAQFVVMSLSGFAATAAVVVAFYLFLPDEFLASRVARGGALFLAFLGVVLEVPLLLTGLVRGRVPGQVSV